MTDITEKSCKHCGLKIPFKAIKCYKCGSYLNWRNYLNFSATILSLIIAILSILATGGSQIRNFFSKEKIILNIALSHENKENLFFTVINTGNKAVALNSDAGCIVWEIQSQPDPNAGQENDFVRTVMRHVGRYTLSIYKGDLIQPGEKAEISYFKMQEFYPSPNDKLEVPPPLSATERISTCDIYYKNVEGSLTSFEIKIPVPRINEDYYSYPI